MNKPPFHITKIISGGQTGADQAGLAAGKELGLETGGWMPKGFRTDDGARLDFKQLYSMLEHEKFTYPPRTELNVQISGATFLFGNLISPGTKLTQRFCLKHGKRHFFVPWKPGQSMPTTEAEWSSATEPFRDWLNRYSDFDTLNVAGNRERTNPGIFLACKEFLVRSLKIELGRP
jgi:hypothetical protein